MLIPKISAGLTPDPVHDLRGDVRPDHGRARHREVADTGLQGRHPEHLPP